jgi:two-component system sensor histidine kinase UhpB
MGRIGSNGAGGLARAGTQPDDPALALAEAPEACTRCHNAAFVRDMLDELDRSLVKARQYQDRLTQMAAQVAGAQEDERKRIARELHDETAQALAAVLVRVSVLERSPESGKLRAQLGELRDLTEATLDGVRRLATDLRPPMLDDLGLEEALRAHVRDWSPRWSTNVTLTGSQLGRLPGDVELALFRVVQEALSNVAKHARASRAQVSMSRRGRTLRLAVEDDGCGFDVEAARDSRLGLFGMQERLALIGGTLAIHSAPGRGTRVCAQVPLPRSRGVR